MNKLNKVFQKNQVLTAAELNAISNKIDEIINALSSIDTGGSGSGSGEGSQYDDSEIREALEDLQDAIDRANATANEERERLDGVIDDINDTVEDKVNEMLTDKDFLDELKEGIQSESNFGDDDVDAYLQQIGIITRNNGQVTYGWSTIAQDVNSLRASVNNLIENGVDQEALQAAINAKIEDSVASLDLSTMYARKNAETVIEWMYSALKQSTSADKSYNEIVSAGKSGLSSAIAELRTYVEKLKNGEYVATASMEAKVDEAIAGLKASASSNNAKTEIFNKISKTNDDVASILFSITGSDSKTNIVNRINTWKAGLTTKADLNSATAELMAANDFTSAAVIAKVNEYGGSVKISADKIDLDGYVTATDMEAGNITVKGDVKATSFEVIDNNNPTIVFTTMSDAYRGAGYENLNASAIQNGEPIGLVYNPQTHTPKYFFDFAPVANSGGTSNTLKRYILSDSDVTQTSNYYYNTSGVYYSNQAGTTLATDNNITYQLQGQKNVFVRHTSSGSGAHQDVFIATVSKYVGCTYTNGSANYTGNVYYRVSNVDGADYWLSIPNKKSSIINPNVNIKTGFGGVSLSQTSSGVQFENVSETDTVSLWVLDTTSSLFNLSGKTITSWQAGQYYINTSNVSA